MRERVCVHVSVLHLSLSVSLCVCLCVCVCVSVCACVSLFPLHQVSLRRLSTYYIWKVLFIVSIIVLIAAVAFFLRPTDLSDRTGICVTLYVGTSILRSYGEGKVREWRHTHSLSLLFSLSLSLSLISCVLDSWLRLHSPSWLGLVCQGLYAVLSPVSSSSLSLSSPLLSSPLPSPSVSLSLSSLSSLSLSPSFLRSQAYNTKMDFYLYTAYLFVLVALIQNVVVFSIAEEMDVRL